MAALQYGTTVVQMSDDQADVIAELIREIVSKGNTEWLALNYQTEAGRPGTRHLLITPGVPIMFDVDFIDDERVSIKGLLDAYLH